MARPLALPILVTLALVATSTGCSVESSPTASVSSSCNVARTGLTAMVSLLDSTDVAYDERENQPLDVTTAADITDRAKALGERLGDGEVGAAYRSVETALIGFADSISAEGNSPAVVTSARQGVDSAANDLIALCAVNTTAPSVTTSKVATSTSPRVPIRGKNGEGDNTTDLVPAVEVGQTRSGTMFDTHNGTEGTWTVRLERVTTSINPLTWGRDYVIRLDAGLPGAYTFADGNGEEYLLFAAWAPSERSLYFNSDDPRLTVIGMETE